MAIEIVDFPSYNMVIFHSYVSLPEGNCPILGILDITGKSSHLVDQKYRSWLGDLKNGDIWWPMYHVYINHIFSLYYIILMVCTNHSRYHMILSYSIYTILWLIQGLLNVLFFSHHTTVGICNSIVSNKYLKVMWNKSPNGTFTKQCLYLGKL